MAVTKVNYLKSIKQKLDSLFQKYTSRKYFRTGLSLSLNGATVLLISALLQNIYIDLLEKGLSKQHYIKVILEQAVLASLLVLLLGIVWMYLVHSRIDEEL